VGRAVVDVPRFYHQCLTSVAPAWPPRNESITLNNVNVSPSQHKTNNHRARSYPPTLLHSYALPLGARDLRSSPPGDPFRQKLFRFSFSARNLDSWPH